MMKTTASLTGILLATALLAVGRRSAEASCVLPNCLFGCCEDGSFALPTPGCVANGEMGCVSDTSSVTLGVRFTTSKDICITGIEFYNEDPSQAFSSSLWNQATGTPIAFQSAPPGSSGWITTNIPPVPMTSGNEFVAAYFAPSGAYAYEYYFYNGDVTMGPVTFKGGVNGVYKYGGPNTFPNDGPYQNSNYFVTPVWKPKWSYYVWNATSDAQVEEIYDGYVGCIHLPYNLEARPNCQSPTSVAFKLYNLSTKTVVIRTTENEYPYFVWENLGSDVLPNRKPLPDNVYQLYTTVGTKTEIITFTQFCPPST